LEGELFDLVKWSQQEAYPEKLKRLQQKKGAPSTSQLLPLTPFMDEAGVLWLGGRLSRAKLPYDMLHPQILSDRHLFARLIFGGGGIFTDDKRVMNDEA
jgi:hypothetical protein